MVKQQSFLMPPFAWYFTSFGFMVFLSCTGISVVRTRQYELRIAEYQLAVGSALSEVKKVSSTLGQSADTLPIAPQQRWKIEQRLEESNAVIDKTEDEIEQRVDELLNLEN